MDLQNAARFDEVVNVVFSALADAFPKPIDLNFDELGLAEGPAFENRNGMDVDSAHIEKHTFAASCVRFLESEGYVSGRVLHVRAEYVVFTSKGLERIGGLPDSLRTVF